MTDDGLGSLLHRTADAIEPGDRLDAIRAATSGGRRTTWVWWAAGSAGLAAAAVVSAIALVGGPPDRGAEPGPATTSEARAMAVYYVGDTFNGLRLFREFRRLEGDTLQTAVSAAVGRDADDVSLPPLDRDYYVPWPSITTADATLTPGADEIEISLFHRGESLRGRGSLSAKEAELAVEQLIRTAQAAVGGRLPVRFLLGGEITDRVLGVPASEPLAEGDASQTLADLFLSDPSERQVVDNDGVLTVTGVRNAYRGPVDLYIQAAEPQDRMEVPVNVQLLWNPERSDEFRESFDASGWPPGEYVLTVSTDQVSGLERDSRRITVVD